MDQIHNNKQINLLRWSLKEKQQTIVIIYSIHIKYPEKGYRFNTSLNSQQENNQQWQQYYFKFYDNYYNYCNYYKYW